MSLKVAVTGVTNGLGYAIASALLDTPHLQVVLLTRQSPTPDLTHFTSLGAVHQPVNHSSIPDLTSALKGVNTVINTIYNAELASNLIKASKAAGVRRFAPSDYAFATSTNAGIAHYQGKVKTLAELEESGLEYTSFLNGVFMDYLGFGAPKGHEGRLYLFPFVINVATQKAAIPGNGEQKMTYTRIRDVGRFVAAAVKFEGKWPKELGMVGETKTYNEIVKEVEEITGRKIDVEYLDEEKIASTLEESKGEEVPGKYFFNQVYEVIANDLGSVEPALNQLAPHIKVTSIKELLAEYWL